MLDKKIIFAVGLVTKEISSPKEYLGKVMRVEGGGDYQDRGRQMRVGRVCACVRE